MASGSIFNLSGKIALITGGGSGLGRAYCEAMAEFGADVACADILEQRAEETVKNIISQGHRAIAVNADVSKQADIKNMVDMVVEELGNIDIVFANAGVMERVLLKIHEYPIEDFDRLITIHTRGTLLLMQAIFPIMMRQKSGSFITMGSNSGMWPVPPGGIPELFNGYAPSKAGVIILTKLAARQYGEYGIRVNCICPGYHRTNITPLEDRAKAEQLFLPLTPLKRLGVPEDIKGLAVYLASDASRFVTGQTFIEDGGFGA